MAGFDERMLKGFGVFAAIVETGSFAAAGDVLDMSQPGVSRAISRLEGRLGIRLFDRTTRVVSMTDEGRRFYEQVAPLMASLDEATANVSGSATAVRGRLRINVDPLFSSIILGPKLETFLEKYPGLQLELFTRDHLGDMVAEGFDLAVRFGHPRSSSLVARKLLDTRIVTVAAPAYLEKRGHPSTPEEIADGKHTCIEFRDPQTGHPFDWEFHCKRKKIVVETKGQLILNDGRTLLSVCLAGYGMAQVLELAVRDLLTERKLVDLFPDWPDERFPLYAFHPSRHHPPAKTRAFLDFVISLAGKGI